MVKIEGVVGEKNGVCGENRECVGSVPTLPVALWRLPTSLTTSGRRAGEGHELHCSYGQEAGAAGLAGLGRVDGMGRGGYMPWWQLWYLGRTACVGSEKRTRTGL